MNEKKRKNIEQERFNQEEQILIERARNDPNEELRIEQAEQARIEREEQIKIEREEKDKVQQDEKYRLKQVEKQQLEREEKERFDLEEKRRFLIEVTFKIKQEEKYRLEQQEKEKLFREEKETLDRENNEKFEHEKILRLELEAQVNTELEEQAQIQREVHAEIERREHEKNEHEKQSRLAQEEKDRLSFEERYRFDQEEQNRLDLEERAQIEQEERAQLEREETKRLEQEEKELLGQEEKERLQHEEELRIELEHREQARLLQEELANLPDHSDSYSEGEDSKEKEFSEEFDYSSDDESGGSLSEDSLVEDEEVIDVKEMFQTIFIQSWISVKYQFFLNTNQKFPFPSATFPIFSTILESRLLLHYEPSFILFFLSLYFKSSFLQLLFDADQFLLSVLIDQLVEFYSHKFDSQSVALFHESMKQFINHLFLKLFRPFTSTIEGLSNRIASASFVVDRLINDFAHLLKSFQDKFPFPKSIYQQFLQLFSEELDRKISNKILANKKKFTVTNGILWNSVCTRIESTLSIHLPLFRQSFAAFMMIEKFSNDSTLRRELCPDIPDCNILYIMINVIPDENLPKKPDATAFSEFSLLDFDVFPMEVSTKSLIDLFSLKKDLNYEQWNFVLLHESFPTYFSEYANKNLK